MQNLATLEPVDYLVIGHLTQDLTERGPQLGGTAAYSSLTAKALGLRVGIVTSMSPETDISLLDGIQVSYLPSEYSSTFKNIYTPDGRIQYLYHTAERLNIHLVPETWRNAPIVHLGPVIQEVEPGLAHAFPNALIGVTPQGYLREADAEGRIHRTEWPEYRYVLEQAAAAVLSIEDVQGDESRIDEMASAARVLVATEGAAGCRLFWNGDLRRFRPPVEVEVDPVGAGDIFAAAFFVRLYSTRDPWEAARFATLLAANSVTRVGLAGVPTPEEIQASLIQVV
jgi:sugar/nucleoside kinase (ribokinase family)